jgi:hypothetical protein
MFKTAMSIIKNLIPYFLTYSLFYFALRMWRRQIEFLPEIQNSFLVVEMVMFFLTALLFNVNLVIQKRTKRIKNSVAVNVCLSIFLLTTNNVLWNIYAYLMRPDFKYLEFSFAYVLGYFLISLLPIMGAFGLTKFLIFTNESRHMRS